MLAGIATPYRRPSEFRVAAYDVDLNEWTYSTSPEVVSAGISCSADVYRLNHGRILFMHSYEGDTQPVKCQI